MLAFLALLILVFFLSRLTGDPTNLFLPMDASLETRREFTEKHGFDDPLYMQFLNYLSGLSNLDFGESIFQGRSALSSVLAAFPITLKLAAVTITLAIILAVLLGSYAAFRPYGMFDRISSMLSVLSASTPDFWIAIVGILVFSVSLGWLPTSGMGGVLHWVMPVCVLLLRPLGILTNVVRVSMLASLTSPYSKTAQAKGASDLRIIYVHALRNSMLPVITVAGDLMAGLINGAVVVETIFGWPGIGNLMIVAIQQRDFAVVQACVIFTALAIFLLNIVIDVVYVILDPRIKSR